MAGTVVKPDGFPGVVGAAHLVPANGTPASNDELDEIGNQPAWAFLAPRLPSQLDVDFLDLINSLEEELARARRVSSKQDKRDRAILVSVTTGSNVLAQESLDELKELARSSGVVVLDSIIQR